MPVEIKNKVDLVSKEFLDELDNFIEYLIYKSKEKYVSDKKDCARPHGIPKGKIQTADDFDKTPESEKSEIEGKKISLFQSALNSAKKETSYKTKVEWTREALYER